MTTSKQPFLPKFSDAKDVDEFVAKLQAFESGEINAEQFRAFRLLRGVYGQRQSDVQMFRIKIPMGILGPEQLVAVADVPVDRRRGQAELGRELAHRQRVDAVRFDDAARRRGNRTVNSVNSPNSLSTSIVPPCASMNCLASGRPSPSAECPASAVRWKRSKTLACSAGRMPRPLSETWIVTRLASPPAWRRTRPPASV